MSTTHSAAPWELLSLFRYASSAGCLYVFVCCFSLFVCLCGSSLTWSLRALLHLQSIVISGVFSFLRCPVSICNRFISNLMKSCFICSCFSKLMINIDDWSLVDVHLCSGTLGGAAELCPRSSMAANNDDVDDDNNDDDNDDDDDDDDDNLCIKRQNIPFLGRLGLQRWKRGDHRLLLKWGSAASS